MTQRIDVAILFEKAHRELDVACAIQVMAESRGLSVVVLHQDFDYGEALQHYRPRVVVLPFCYQNRSNNIYLMRWRDAIFVNFTWEQFFYPGNQKAKTPRGVFPLRHVLHVAWSCAYAELLAGIGVPPERVRLIGNPALALYREPYLGYFKGRAELAAAYGLDPVKKWVFFPENYNWAFYEDQMLRQMVADGQAQEDVDAMRAFATRSFEEVMGWCRRLVEESGAELILRPRPSTVPARMCERVEAAIGPLPPNFHILQEETVREWILAADMVVSSYSTSLIEAAVAGREILMLEPEPLPECLIQAWHPLAPRAASYAAFAEAVAAAFAKPRQSHATLAAWATERLLGAGDPLRATVDLLEGLCCGEVPRPPVATRASVTYGCPKGLPWFAWWLWKYARTFVSQYKALSGVRHIPPSDIVADVAAKRTVPARCARWRTFLPR